VYTDLRSVAPVAGTGNSMRSSVYLLICVFDCRNTPFYGGLWLFLFCFIHLTTSITGKLVVGDHDSKIASGQLNCMLGALAVQSLDVGQVDDAMMGPPLHRPCGPTALINRSNCGGSFSASLYY